MTFGKLNHRRRESIATSLHDRVMTRNSIEEGIGLYDQNVFAIFFFLSGRAPNRRFIIRRFQDSVSPFAFVHFVVRICVFASLCRIAYYGTAGLVREHTHRDTGPCGLAVIF